jgi:transcription elongation factor
VHALTQRILATVDKPLQVSGKKVDSTTSIFSVFFNPTSRGCIYAETDDIAVMRTLCKEIPYLFRNPQITLIELDHRPDLLKMRGYVPPTVGAFVRISRGEYKGDVGLVQEIFQDTDFGVEVAVLPRIDMSPPAPLSTVAESSQTGQRRRAKRVKPPQTLFQPTLVEHVYPGQVKRRNQLHIFRNTTYRAGIAELTLSIKALEDTDALPSVEELKLFHKALKFEPTMLANYVDRLTCAEVEIGDKVVVLGGEQEGLEGVVKENKRNTVVVAAKVKEVVIATSNPDDRRVLKIGKAWDVEVPAARVERRFDVGNAVLVLKGPEAGSRGFITQIDTRGLLHIFTRDGFVQVSTVHTSHLNYT